MNTDHRFNNTKSNCRIFFFSQWPLQLCQPSQNTPETTEYAGQPPQNTQANTQITKKKKKQNHFFSSPEGVPVTIKQEQNNFTEFFEGTTRVGLGQCCRQ